MGYTDRFSLNTFGPEDPGSSLIDDAGKFGSADRRLIDKLLAHFETHSHSILPTPKLADPTLAPALALSTGGSLRAGTTYRYAVTFIDQYGLETAAGPISTIDTPAPLSVPAPPDLNAQSLSEEPTGTLGAGMYYYALTAISADGVETTLGNPNMVTLLPGDSAVSVGWGELAPVVDSISIWRRGPGKQFYTRVGTALSTAETFTDLGVVVDDPCACEPENQPPSGFAPFDSVAIQITLPSGLRDLLDDESLAIQAWRLYRSDTAGIWPSGALVQDVRGTVDIDDPDSGFQYELTDLGHAYNGKPPALSQTLVPPTPITPVMLSSLLTPGATGQQGFYQGWPFVELGSGTANWTPLCLSLEAAPTMTAPEGAAVVTPAGVYRRQGGSWVLISTGDGSLGLTWSLGSGLDNPFDYGGGAILITPGDNPEVG